MFDIGRMVTIKTFWVLANIVCTIVLAIQLFNVLESFLKPTITRTWEEEVPLEDIEFPLVVKICVIPGFNQTALHEVGYEDTWGYFHGQSRFDDDVLGWAGHTEDSGTFGSVEETLAKVSDNNFDSIISNVHVWTKDEENIDIPFEHLKASRVNYPNNCRNLALNGIPDLEGKRIQQLFISIGDFEDHAVEIQLNGATLDCRRNIREHSLQSTGDAIRLDRENVSRAYMVDITQRDFVENDPTNTCRDYPNLEYLSYEECDDQFVRDLLPGLTPVWLTEDFEEVSTLVSDEDGTFGELIVTSFRTNIAKFHFKVSCMTWSMGALCPIARCRAKQARPKQNIFIKIPLPKLR